MKKLTTLVFTLLLAVVGFEQRARAQATEITYQGQLQSSSALANGNFDFEFVLFDGGGSQIGATISRSAVAVANGIFSVNLDFGSSFPGANRFLEIRVRQAGGGGFTTLSPRQPLTSAPYSIKSLTADNAANAANATNASTATNAINATNAVNATNAATATNFTGNLSGDVTGTQNATTVARIQSRNVAGTAPLGGQVLKYNSTTSQWEPDTDNAGTGGGGGTITGVTPGTGLSGGGATGNVTLNIANGGVGTAQLADNSVTDAKINSVSGAKVTGTVANATNATNAVNATNFTGSLSGDVTGIQGATVVTMVGGQSAASVGGAVQSVNTATSNNTPNTLVRRDGLGNFAAGTITGNLTGTASTATNATTATTADTATNALSLGGVAASQYLQTNGNGSGLTNLNASSIATGTISNARLGQIPTANIADNAVTAPKIASGQVVKGVTVGATTLTDNVTVVGGTNISVTSSANTVTIASTGGGVGGSGTTNTIPLWNSGTTLGNSAITQGVTGNVGIGITNPSARLDVSGLGRFVGVDSRVASGDGVYAQSASGNGVFGVASGSDGVGLNGLGVGGGRGVYGSGSTGVEGVSTSGVGVRGTGSDGVHAVGTDPNGVGIFAANSAGGSAGNFSGRVLINGGPAWTTAQWGNSLRLGNASAIGWAPNSSGSSYGIGHSNGGMYFFRTTSAPGSTGSGAIYNMVITDNDLVGIGTLNPDSTLTVNGGASKASGGTTWAVFSDERLKNIKGRFTPGLQALMKLQPIRYQYKSDNALGLKGDEDAVGFSAQAVAEILPEAVHPSTKGYLQLNGDPILWTMLNAIKEQQAQIEALKKMNSALGTRLKTVERKFQKRAPSSRRR